MMVNDSGWFQFTPFENECCFNKSLSFSSALASEEDKLQVKHLCKNWHTLACRYRGLNPVLKLPRVTRQSILEAEHVDSSFDDDEEEDHDNDNDDDDDDKNNGIVVIPWSLKEGKR